MDAELRSFRESLCQEHLDEVSALHDICSAQRADPLADWRLPSGFEWRIDAHIDALAVGGEVAEALGSEALDRADEPGACLAAAAARALRSANPAADASWSAWAGGVPGVGASALAVVEGLCEYMAPSDLAGFLQAGPSWAHDPAHAGWRLLARRRVDTGGMLATHLAAGTAAPAGALLEAATACPDRIDPEWLAPWLRSDDAGHRHRAAAASILRGGRGTLDTLLAEAKPSDPLLLALVGGRGAVLPLLRALQADDTAAAAAVGLGLLGELSAVRPLIAGLAREPIAARCAQALYVITGLAPGEVVHLADPVSEDELFEREHAAFRRDGTVPKAADGLPYGRRVERLSQDEQLWGELLRQHASAFSGGVRYRFGRPCSATVMLQGLLAPGLGSAFREPMVLELRLRHGVDVPLALTMPVATQVAAVRSVLQRLAAEGPADEAGRWHLARQILPD